MEKRPLLEYEEWRAIEVGYEESSQNTGHLDAQARGAEIARWLNWQAQTIDEQWSWLTALKISHRRRPVLDITDELGGNQRDGGIPDCSEGGEERDLDISDRNKEPRLAIQEKAKLPNCDRKCSEEEWRSMAIATKWGTLEAFVEVRFFMDERRPKWRKTSQKRHHLLQKKHYRVRSRRQRRRRLLVAIENQGKKVRKIPMEV